MRANRRVRNIASSILVGVALLTVGVVVAGAVFSGQQLILRFLITVVVAALGFYIISDLRLQKTQVLVASPSPSSHPTNPSGSAATMPIVQFKSDQDVVPTPPSDSTAAYMARASTTGEETLTPTYGTNVEAKPRSTSVLASAHTPNDEIATTTQDASDSQTEKNGEEPVSPLPSSDTSVVDEAVVDEAETTANASPLIALDTPTTMPSEAHHCDAADQTSILRVEDLADSSNDDTCIVATGETPLPPGYSARQSPETTVEAVNIEAIDTSAASDAVDADQLDETSTASERTETSDPARPRILTRPKTTTGRRRYSAEELKQSGLVPTPIARSEVKKRLLGSNQIMASALPDDQINSALPNSLSAINDAIFEGEQKIIKSLIDRGVLSSEGPITDEDVSTMVYVAFTSLELKNLLVSGGSVDRDPKSPALEKMEIYTSNDLSDANQFLVAGPESAIDILEEKVTL